MLVKADFDYSTSCMGHAAQGILEENAVKKACNNNKNIYKNGINGLNYRIQIPFGFNFNL